MITGLWKNVRLVCGNPAHGTNEIMFLKQTPEDVFYACPKYDPENRSPDEKPCMNRISVNEAEKMLDVLAEKIQDEESENGSFFAKNFRFETRIGKYKVLQCTESILTVKALNRRAQINPKQI